MEETTLQLIKQLKSTFKLYDYMVEWVLCSWEFYGLSLGNSVIAYFDTEENIKNDITFGGEFKTILEYDEICKSVVDYDEMKLKSPYYMYE